MSSKKNWLLVLSSGGMMLSTIFACASFVFACMDQRLIPLPEAALILFAAAMFTAIHSQRGCRRLTVIGLHLLGLSFIFLRLCHTYYGVDAPFWRMNWLQPFFMLERTAAGWSVLVLIAFSVWVLWFCGIRLITRPTDQTTISFRFDIGLGFFLLLLLAKLIIALKGVSIPVEHSSIRPLISYMVLGLFSMGVVRVGSPSDNGGAAFIKGAGIALTFSRLSTTS